MADMHDKTVVVTGGTSGMGQAIAHDAECRERLWRLSEEMLGVPMNA